MIDSDIVEIIPNQSIGPLRMGAKRADLPELAKVTVQDNVGFFRDIKFWLKGDTVKDVWIDNLRTFPYNLRFKGRTVPHDAAVDDIKRLFGPCTPGKGATGGDFF